MIVRQIEDIEGSDNEVKSDNWTSKRILLAKDKMGFSFHETIIHAGTQTHIWYKNHLEAVYCIEGKGEIELIPSGTKYDIRPGTMYALDKHDEHYLRASESLRLVCVFNPPLTGRETHDEDGVYPLLVEPEQVENHS
jgi:L-ectoine synthase